MIRPRSCQPRRIAFRSRVSNATTATVAIALTVGFCAGPAVAQFTNGTMTCKLSSNTASPGTSVTLDLFLEDVVDVRGYQATIAITQVSGSGDVTVPCPGGIAVDSGRSDYIFSALETNAIQPGCSNCGVIVPDCDGRRVAAARVNGAVDVGTENGYLATVTLQVSLDASPGSEFDISISDDESILLDPEKIPIDFSDITPCRLRIVEERACCLPDDTCVTVAPTACTEQGGIVQPPGSACGTDSDGDGVDDLCDVCSGVDDGTFGDDVCEISGTECVTDDDCPIGQSCLPACEVAIPAMSEWGLVVLFLLLLVTAKIYFGRRGKRTVACGGASASRGGSTLLGLALALMLAGPASAQVCQNDNACDDGVVCTDDLCLNGACLNTPVPSADVAGPDGCGPDGTVDENDIFAVTDGFSGNFGGACSLHNLDLHDPFGCAPDGLIDLFDIATVLDAYRGDPNCPCTVRTDVETPKRECEEECPGDTDPIYLFSGELHESAVDLRILGRGLHFTWERKYRSKIGPNTVMGNGWDFSYNIYLETNGPDLVLHDGNTRSDTYTTQPNGTWTRREFFQVIEQKPDGSHKVTFPDTKTWNFHPFDTSAQEGKIVSIVDRNGNTISFAYDAGRLVTISDSLGRDISITYNGEGFIESVTDFAGRSVTYAYYDGVEPGGNFGDLKSVTTPAVVNTADFPVTPMHEYPNGKTTVYTYSTGSGDDRLNHNLLTKTDPKGQTYAVNEYHATTDSNDLNYDRIKRQTWGDTGDIIDLVYVELSPTPTNGFAITQAILDDRVGNVKEYFFDARNRAVIVREYTGRWDPDAPTTAADLPTPLTPRLRPTDPPYFETRRQYNNDSLPTHVTDPNGNAEASNYDTDNANRRSQGNLKQRCTLPGPLGGEQAQICDSYEYDEGHGGCCGTNFVTRHVDGRGYETLHTYDDHGNRCRTQHRIPSIVEDFTYNQFGQMTSHVLPDNGNGHRRMDVCTYYDTGSHRGYLKDEIIDAPAASAPSPGFCPAPPMPAGPNFALTTTHEYNIVGQEIRTIDPRGHDTQYIVNQLDQTVQSISREVTDGGGVRYERDTFYDPNDNVVRVDIQNVDDTGTLQANTHFTTIHEYDILNYRTRMCQEVGDNVAIIPGTLQVPLCSGLPESEFITTEYEYDAVRNRTLVRYGEAVEGRQPHNVVETRYDERNLVYREIRAPGDPNQSTTQYDYDEKGNVVRTIQGIEDLGPPHRTNYTYDGYDRLLTSTDAMGNVTTSTYDANHNREGVRVDGELIDVPGSAGNVRLFETIYVYDAMDRLIRTEVAFFDTDTQTPLQGGQQAGKSITRTDYSDNSQVIRTENDNLHQTATVYDTAHRASVVTDHKNNTVAYGYDANSNVVSVAEVDKSDLGNPDESFVTNSVYDNLDRLIQTVDNVGNTNAYDYDSRDNRAHTIDALTNETRYSYDGISRLVRTTRDLDDDGADGDGVDITTAQAWDDTSRLTGQGDDNGNVTTYAYDPLNRLTRTLYADGTDVVTVFDVHHTEVIRTDANDSVSTNQYDLLDRLTSRAIAPGAGVSSDTTSETYKYDGLSRLVYAEDNDSIVTRKHDSLSSVTSETLNAQKTTSVCDGVGNQTACTYPGGRRIATAYDELERKGTITDTTGGGGALVARYDYVGPGRVERREYGNGTSTEYTYDGITGVPDPANDFGVKRIIRMKHSLIATGAIVDERTYLRDKMYNKTQRKDVRNGGPQLTHDYAYDDVYRLTRTIVTDPLAAVLRDTTYDLDGVGNRTTVTGAPDPGQHVGTYTMQQGPPPLDHEMNQYTTTPPDGREYDKNGNLIRINAGMLTQRDIAYDYRNQMVEHTNPEQGARHSYAYDALGRRIAKRRTAYELTLCGPNPAANSCSSDAECAMGTLCVDMGGCPPSDCTCDVGHLTFICTTDCAFECQPHETRYFYDGWQVVEEQDRFGNTEATYVYGLYIDEVLNMRREYPADAVCTNDVTQSCVVNADCLTGSACILVGPDWYYHTDDLFNVMAVTNQNGLVFERYEYQDYGEPHFLSPPGVPMAGTGIGNPYLFTGRRYDPETAWYYYRTRYLDPATGGFTVRDTVGIWADEANLGNGRTYVGNNPSTHLDPSGRLLLGNKYVTIRITNKKYLNKKFSFKLKVTIPAYYCLKIHSVRIEYGIGASYYTGQFQPKGKKSKGFKFVRDPKTEEQWVNKIKNPPLPNRVKFSWGPQALDIDYDKQKHVLSTYVQKLSVYYYVNVYVQWKGEMSQKAGDAVADLYGYTTKMSKEYLERKSHSYPRLKAKPSMRLRKEAVQEARDREAFVPRVKE